VSRVSAGDEVKADLLSACRQRLSYGGAYAPELPVISVFVMLVSTLE